MPSGRSRMKRRRLRARRPRRGLREKAKSRFKSRAKELGERMKSKKRGGPPPPRKEGHVYDRKPTQADREQPR